MIDFIVGILFFAIFFGYRFIKASLGYPVEPIRGTTYRRARATGVRYAAYSGLRGRRR